MSDQLPALTAGIRARAYASVAAGDPATIEVGRYDHVGLGWRITMDASEVYDALEAVDPAAAEKFRQDHDGPWSVPPVPFFEYDPQTTALRRLHGGVHI